MNYKQKFSVKAILRTDKEKVDGTCPINYQIIIDKKPTKLSSKECSVKPSDWVKNPGCVKGSRSSQVNCDIDRDISNIKDFLSQQRALGNILTIELVKTFWSTNDSDDFYEFYDAFCESKFKQLAKGTQNHYVLLRKRLKEYKSNIKLSQIDLMFIKGFDNFLRNKLKTGDSGIRGRHKNLKVVLTDAYKSNRVRKNPYDDFKLLKEDPAEVIYLSPIEIRIIEKKRFSEFPRGHGLLVTRDIFLFSCYTGLRFSDLTSLKSEHVINQEMISLRQQKTKNGVQIPLNPKALKILSKYQSDDRKTIFPTRANATINRDLKQIAAMCKIKKKVKFHLGRHTFASLLANEGANLFQIKTLLGHRSIKMTERYLSTTLKDLQKTMKIVPIFNNH